jgi:ribonuclease HI
MDGRGEVVAEHFGFIGTATNNVAEYQALVHAFKLASTRGARRIEIRSDSELVVKQMNGIYKVKHPAMLTLWRQASTQRRAFEVAEIKHVRREQNKEADALANRAMDLQDSHLSG